jgi:uncharacterized protein with HEPN domain
MSRDFRVYLEDIVEAAGRIGEYTKGLSQDDFSQDRKTVDAVVRNLEVIGEAAKKVPDDVRQLASHIDWRKIAGLRDILIHQYFGIDLEIIWNIVTTKVADLDFEIRNLLDTLNTQDSN